MDAYQYFYVNGQPVGKSQVGEMEFDTRSGHQHWHFLQFAKYSLLDATQTELIRSYPCLAGEALAAKRLGTQSLRDQFGAGLHKLEPDQSSRLAELNAAYSAKFVDLFGPPRKPGLPFFTSTSGYPSYFGPKPSNFAELQRDNERYADIAASIQRVTEEVLLTMARAYAAALTDATGHFVLENVPSGANVPLVVTGGCSCLEHFPPNLHALFCVLRPPDRPEPSFERVTEGGGVAQPPRQLDRLLGERGAMLPVGGAPERA